MTPFCYNCFISISLKDWWRWKHFAWCMQVQQSDSGSFHCYWISCIALGSGRDLLCGSSNQKRVYPLTTALKDVVFLWTKWGLVLSFTEAVRHSSQKRRKVKPYGACSATNPETPFPPCHRDGGLGRVNLSVVCSPPPESMVPCLPSSALEGVASALAEQHCSCQHCCAGGGEERFWLV